MFYGRVLRKSSGREVIEISSDSDPVKFKRLERDFQYLLTRLGPTVPIGTSLEMADSGIDLYLEAHNARKHAQQRSQSSASTSTSCGHAGEIVGQELVKWYLSYGLPVQEPGRSMTTKEMEAMRHKYCIPESVLLRPLNEGELATSPPLGWVAVHEHQFKCGLSLPLHPWVQSTLLVLNVAIGQVTPNIWKQLLGLYVIWELLGNGWPTYDDVLSLYQLSYSINRFCSGAVTLKSRGKSIVTQLPTSTVNWRSTVCLAGGWWGSEGGEVRKTVQETFQTIGCAFAFFLFIVRYFTCTIY